MAARFNEMISFSFCTRFKLCNFHHIVFVLRLSIIARYCLLAHFFAAPFRLDISADCHWEWPFISGNLMIDDNFWPHINMWIAMESGKFVITRTFILIATEICALLRLYRNYTQLFTIIYRRSCNQWIYSIKTRPKHWHIWAQCWISQHTMCIWWKLSIVNFLGKRNSFSFPMSMPITNSLSWKWIVRTSTPEKVIGEGARNRGGKEKFYYEVYFRFSSPAEFRICVQQYLLTEAMWWHRIAASALPLRLVCEF